MNKRDEFSVTLVGAGNMGGAMLAGWLADGRDPSAIAVIDPAPSGSVRKLVETAGLRNFAAAPRRLPTDVLVLAVKPQIISAVMSNVRHLAGKGTACVSIAAGTTIARLRTGLGEDCAIIRAMPNTPALVRRAITVACPERALPEAMRARVDALLTATGSVAWIEDETLMDAVTALSGSGPAYLFHLVECMAAAGENAGLPADLAARLARETVCGAAELLERSEHAPAKLRENVTSPNGTTAAALGVLMGEPGLADLIGRAVATARQRSRELSE
jgi:pyrroline-5-carboxylate reductase